MTTRALRFFRRLACLCFALLPAGAIAQNYSDIWWNPAESGWGLTVADHRSQLFAVWFTYREDGKPTWYVIPGGTFSSERRLFRGDVYATTGPAFSAAPFDSTRVATQRVGTASIDFAPAGLAAGTALFSYEVAGVSGSKQIQRQNFGNAAPAWGSDVTDIWWNPAESGWGLTLAQHGNDVFGVWFTYDVDGRPLWVVMPGATFSGADRFTGNLYTTTGPYFGSAAFDASQVRVTQEGSATVSVTRQGNANSQCNGPQSATLQTSFRGSSSQKPICAQPFGDRAGVTSDAPPPMTPPPGTPQQQATAFADALARATDLRGRLAVWLGIYKALGVPVIDESGVSLTGTGEDPAGPPYWVIWYGAGMDERARGMSLVDAGKILTIRPTGGSDATAGNVLLADLRAALSSSDARAQLFGAFVRERILRGRSGRDLAANVPAADLVVDSATVQLLQWVLVRNTVAAIARARPPGLAAAKQAKAGKPRCAEMFGSEDTTTMVRWIYSRITTGIEVPLVGQMGGLVEVMLREVGGQDLVDTAQRHSARANAAALLVSLYMQIDSLRAEPDMAGPLVRSKTIADGERKSVRWRLYYDVAGRPDGNNLAACLGTWLLNTFGVSLNFPAGEGIAGADLTFEPGRNIPQKVLFDSNRPNYRITTDATGWATQQLIGRGQRRNLPASARAYDDTFTIFVSGQPEEVSGGSIANMFLDSLSFAAAPSLAGIVGPVTNVLKTLHYELGEFEFLLTDWSVGYEVDWSEGGNRTWGTICNGLENPFTLNFDAGGFIRGTLAFAPSSATAGAVTLSGQLVGVGVTYSASGTYTVAGEEIRLSIPQQTAVIPDVGTVTAPGFTQSLPLLATDKC